MLALILRATLIEYKRLVFLVTNAYWEDIASQKS